MIVTQVVGRVGSKKNQILGSIVALLAVLVPVTVFASEAELVRPHADRLVLIEEGPTERSVLHVDGSLVEVETETVWRYMCGSDVEDVSIDEFRAHVQQVKDIFADDQNTWQLHGNARGTGGLNIVWNISGGLPAGAEDALNTAADYIETQFSDPVTVNISIQMFNFGNPNIIGSTGSNFINPSYSTARNGLIADMDGDDTIQNFLPSGSSIPVRFNASSSTVTNQSSTRFTRANYDAAIGTAGGTAASMSFNTGFSFDYDPTNGVPFSQMCFQSVVVHEVGHALGFTSGADSQFSNRFEALDIFRFQFTDGTGDYNPDTEAEFQTTARTVDYNNLDNDVISDLISAEYHMSDGSPYQASHFRTSVFAIMDPNFALGESFYPNYFRTPDVRMFDAIGWDYPALPSPLTAPGSEGVKKNRYLSFDPNNDGGDVAFQVELTSGPGVHGIVGWVGEPDADGRSLVVDQSYYTSTWPAIVRVADCEVVPVASYEMRLIVNGADEGDPDSYSSPLEVSTIDKPGVRFWADSVGELVGTVWTGPNNVVNFNDVTATIQGFQVAETAPLTSWVDIQPEVPNHVVNFADVQFTILGFIGDPYPYSVPSDCP